VGIRAVGIAPGAVDTPMFRRVVGNVAIDADAILRPADVAAMVADLAAGPMRFTSGETLYVHRGPA
jgi:NAD(P)-dependent dehydrogenase (short-subunit alcohol dehydrogenase family)